MTALLEGLEDHTVLLHATAEGRGLYERLGFVRTGEVRQHQGIALPTPLIALGAGWRLRPATEADLPTLRALDAAARGMPRDALIDELFRDADATVVLDHDGHARGFAMLRRFGRGHAIGPVVAPDAEGAQGADRAPVGLERRPLHAHRHRLRQRPGRVARKPGPAARGRADDDGARRAAGARRQTARAATPSSRRRSADAAGLRLQGRPGSAAANGPRSSAAKRRRSTFASGPTSATRPTVRYLAAWEPPADLGDALSEPGAAVLHRRRRRPVRLRRAAAAPAGGAHGRARHRAAAWSST